MESEKRQREEVSETRKWKVNWKVESDIVEELSETRTWKSGKWKGGVE